MSHARKRAELARLLEDIGHTHSLDDLTELIGAGQLQSFVVSDSWAVTQVLRFPRARILEIYLVVGDYEDLPALEDVVATYAKAQGCTLMRAIGRLGFTPLSRAQGWTAGAAVFVKEL